SARPATAPPPQRWADVPRLRAAHRLRRAGQRPARRAVPPLHPRPPTKDRMDMTADRTIVIAGYHGEQLARRAARRLRGEDALVFSGRGADDLADVVRHAAAARSAVRAALVATVVTAVASAVLAV